MERQCPRSLPGRWNFAGAEPLGGSGTGQPPARPGRAVVFPPVRGPPLRKGAGRGGTCPKAQTRIRPGAQELAQRQPQFPNKSRETIGGQ